MLVHVQLQASADVIRSLLDCVGDRNLAIQLAADLEEAAETLRFAMDEHLTLLLNEEGSDTATSDNSAG